MPARAGHRRLNAAALPHLGTAVPPRKSTALLVLATALLAGCAPRLSEDVRVHVDGAYLKVENRSGG